MGDVVTVSPSKPRKRDGFKGTVKAFRADEDGNAVEVTIVAIGTKAALGYRTVRPERITSMDRAKQAGITGEWKESDLCKQMAPKARRTRR